ncbi:MAG: hypothetical protein A2672_00645 [Candidatus Wildermuthbacteria bacterium RIFCSPHIGHO2_01_FULL_49_22b]|uniref:GIY-YIG domain-containing protein n=1 Tax=Candidatus Wildermuthbacteria bacterium RIFCSPHIGHO2_01_FULL_49_22b TaxID=1802448 RepID=A0A1G2R0N7_9BACT|nr:MAG: hypothetical protein A2672_00645 [Candidatus Wildermuthbacteria bacterium RIFCSPHIGHO2_01_FULL_49_22b]
MHYVYVIKSSKKNWNYIGFTSDLRKRFHEHNQGKAGVTKSYRPFTLVYYEAYLSERDARKREIELKKRGQQKEFLKARIVDSLKIASSQPAVDQPPASGWSAVG